VVVLESLSYDFTKENAVVEQYSGCTVLSWEGGDPDGVIDRPWLAFVSCEEGFSLAQTGVNQHGSVKFVLVEGWLTVGEVTISTTGEAIWLQMGVETQVEINGSAYIVGAKYELVNGESAQMLSTYLAPTIRGYFFTDALVRHDEFLNNGTAQANDVAWTSSSTVDPAHILIVSCDDVTIGLHVHPQGAIYLALSGILCFQASGTESCATVGEARWNSPMLRYTESFSMSSESSSGAQNLATLTGLDCTTPLALAVTNFDIGNEAGIPSMVDEPDQNGELLVRMTTVKSFVLVAPQGA
jgi:hypothetical protein